MSQAHMIAINAIENDDIPAESTIITALIDEVKYLLLIIIIEYI